tara:strand:+ start:611 stop:1171 length:561 start_codon:yes stop_codon:yes gene_type:complete
MNQSNLYSYSILTRVWNDLDNDVLLAVKEYLRIYLNKRLLNTDYNMFLEKSNQIYKLYNPDISNVSSSQYRPIPNSVYINTIRYGFDSNVNLIDDNYCLHYKYYLFNTDFCLYLAPCYCDKYGSGLDYIRNKYVHNVTKGRVPTIRNLDDKGRADYIKILMELEEELINDVLSVEEVLLRVDIRDW